MTKKKLFVGVGISLAVVVLPLSGWALKRELRIRKCEDIVLAKKYATDEKRAEAICKTYYGSTDCDMMHKYFNETCEFEKQQIERFRQESPAERQAESLEFLRKEEEKKRAAEKAAAKRAEDRSACLALVEKNLQKYWKESCERVYFNPGRTEYRCSLPKDLVAYEDPLAGNRSEAAFKYSGEKLESEKAILVPSIDYVDPFWHGGVLGSGYKQYLLRFCETRRFDL